MDKHERYSIQLDRGEVTVFDFGTMKLHNYNCKDPLDNQVVILEQDGVAIIIENPSFVESGRELADYLKMQNIKVLGKLLSYHMCGANFLPEVPVYSTRQADAFGHGDGKAIADRFAATFGNDFDALLDKTDIYLKEGNVSLGGFELELIKTEDAFDVEIIVPHFQDTRLLYMHMLGADAHSIVKSKVALDAAISQLSLYHSRGYALILSTHHTPENSRDLLTKINYLRDVDVQAQASNNADEFKTTMLMRYPYYLGEHYLEMTTNLLFSQ